MRIRGFLRRHERFQPCHGFLHHPRAFDDLGQEHFPCAKEIADDAHAGHQRPFNDMQRALGLEPRLFHVGVNELDDALDQRVRQPLLDGGTAPRLVFDGDFTR